jgi:predicted RND superfamily exporter protein
VVVDDATVEFFNDNTEVSRSDRFIREHFGGSTQLILSIADDTQTLLNPQTLTVLDGLASYLIERIPRVTKATGGFTDMVKRMDQLFNMNESPDGIAAMSTADSGPVNEDFDN